MEELLKYANLEIWSIKESTSQVYHYPISVSDQEAIVAGQRLSQGNPKNELRKVGPFLTATSPHSHIGPFLHAIDFLVPDDTTVLAVQAGIVTEIIESNTEWGDGPEYRDKLNFMTIRHFNGEFSQYCHLAQNSVSNYDLSFRSVVKAGQPIAKVGKTGWTDRDHLHFVIFRRDDSSENPFGFKSLQVEFIKI